MIRKKVYILISIAICDDESYMLNHLKENIELYMKQKNLLYNIELFNKVEDLLCNHEKFNIVFLDIQMEEINGMQAARKLRSYGNECFIIFVTVLNEFVFDAFEVDATNYLIKPLSNEKLYKTLDKIVTKLEDNESNYITIQKGYSYWKLKLADILYCEVIKRKIYVHLKKETVDYYETIENLERSLPTNFFRCHRSYIINLQYVYGYENGNAVMESGDRIPVSRLRQQIFSKVMLEFMKNRRI
ncbi:TPA: response regulator transcription factor [Clostridioides difficile]|uniref:LytR/AlgR family response regulator transcription factor n=1 Tax=Clostridioides difficile TaxID=1496 RepID=UPI000BCB672F|nr:LytTR family DNA-binding domain-containing protein [Clostridioides difficile]MBH7210248.1 response regulator transcription factor [Clostridioides difficile]MCI4780344.1 LytTR family DNA-binding domain-containing protein [Clostridioides difficile]MCJ0054786.1 response regulator transcription factor [Clostridioides difficile]PBG94819.1 DNA-binding response regulator [Clostridioides difficile]HBF4428040.1 response regulator transcription factor [Clostridioides difficile]